MGHCGSKSFQTLLLPQTTFEFFQTSPEFSSQWSLRKYSFRFNFDDFSCFFAEISLSPLCHIGKQKKTCYYIKKSHHWEKRSEIWATGGKYSVPTEYLWQLSGQGQSEVIRCISDLRQPCISQVAGRREKWIKMWVSREGKYSLYIMYFWQLSDV